MSCLEIFLTRNIMSAPPSVRTWFSFDHNRITYFVVWDGVQIWESCASKKNKTRLGLGQGGSPRTKGATAFERDMVPLPVLSHPPLELTRLVLSSLWTRTQKAPGLLPEQVPKSLALVCSCYLQKFLPQNCPPPKPPTCPLGINLN